MATTDAQATRPTNGEGCVECLANGGWWFHLRRCEACGHIGCCDSSPERHARGHAEDSGHHVMRSFEPGEDWVWDYTLNAFVDGPEPAEPAHQPLGHAVPGPADAVPANWKSLLRR